MYFLTKHNQNKLKSLRTEIDESRWKDFLVEARVIAGNGAKSLAVSNVHSVDQAALAYVISPILDRVIAAYHYCLMRWKRYKLSGKYVEKTIKESGLKATENRSYLGKVKKAYQKNFRNKLDLNRSSVDAVRSVIQQFCSSDYWTYCSGVNTCSDAVKVEKFRQRCDSDPSVALGVILGERSRV